MFLLSLLLLASILCWRSCCCISIYRTIGYRTQKKLTTAHLCSYVYSIWILIFDADQTQICSVAKALTIFQNNLHFLTRWHRSGGPHGILLYLLHYITRNLLPKIHTVHNPYYDFSFYHFLNTITTAAFPWRPPFFCPTPLQTPPIHSIRHSSTWKTEITAVYILLYLYSPDGNSIPSSKSIYI